MRPKDGDGIDNLLIRYNRRGSEYKKAFIQLNKKNLGKNNSLLLGVRYTLPPLRKKSSGTAKATGKAALSDSKKKGAANEASAKNNRKKEIEESEKEDEEEESGTLKKGRNYEPLFGKQHAHYKVTSQTLSGACFYLVSGHGGPDPGATGKYGKHELHEDEYAYDIMLRLANNLLRRGATVHIIIQDKKDGIRDTEILNNSKRETCCGSRIPFNQVQRLEQRCNKVNGLHQRDKGKYHRAIFIHVDSRSKSEQTDVFFYYQNNKQSRNLANTMKKTFSKKYGSNQPGRGFSGTSSSRGLYVMRNTHPVSVFVELGNLQNTRDRQRLFVAGNRQALANWLTEGFLTDYRQAVKRTKSKKKK